MAADIINDVLWAIGIMGAVLGVLRWKKRGLEPPLTLAVMARTAAIPTLMLGGAHLVEIGGSLLIGKPPYSLRNVEVLWIGGILAFSALSNLAVSRGLRRGERWAWQASGAVTVFVWLFTLSLIPVTLGGSMDSGMNRFLFFMYSLYLAYWATHRPEPSLREPAPSGATIWKVRSSIGRVHGGL